MSLEIALIFAIIIGIILLFAFEVFPIDKISFCLIAVLLITGLVSPDEAISGFSNRATITIMCLMIIAVALEANGVISWMANGLKYLKDWPVFFVIPIFMLITGSISAFISSTAVVIVFIKIITEMSEKFNLPKSKLLLPISFASILGGSCTLMGTSTNLIVNSIYLNRTQDRIAFFEFTWMGVIFLLVSIVVISLLYYLLPQDKSRKLREQYDLGKYIATLEITKDSKLIGQPLKETFFKEEKGVSLLKLTRNGQDRNAVSSNFRLEGGDQLLLSCDLENLLRLKGNEGIILAGEKDPNIQEPVTAVEEEKEGKRPPAQNILVELLMLPGARFLGKNLRQVRILMSNIAIPIAIKRRKTLLRPKKERLYRDAMDPTNIKVGDRILVEIDKEKIPELERFVNIAILQQYEDHQRPRRSKRTLSLLILTMVVLLAATGVLTILSSTIMGVAALLLLNCISLEEVYKKVNWQIIFLLAGMIPLGTAMHNTGADDWLSANLLQLLDTWPPSVGLGLVFLVTMLISGMVSNNATAIIMTPIAISLASGLQLDAKPFVFAVMFASNFSFFTPVGYQTNALVYSMGLYNFRHFFILGGIISIILWLLATFFLQGLL